MTTYGRFWVTAEARASFDSTLEEAKINTRQAHATEVSSSDNQKIVARLSALRTSVEAMANFMSVHEAELRPEDASFDAHLGTFREQVKDLDDQIVDAKTHRYLKRLRGLRRSRR